LGLTGCVGNVRHHGLRPWLGRASPGHPNHVRLQTHAFTHPIRGAAPLWGRATGGVASLNLRLISPTPIGVDAPRLRRLARRMTDWFLDESDNRRGGKYRRMVSNGPSTRDDTKPQSTRQRTAHGRWHQSAAVDAPDTVPAHRATVSRIDRPIPARPTPVGVTEISRGSSASEHPRLRPPHTPAPSRGARERG